MAATFFTFAFDMSTNLTLEGSISSGLSFKVVEALFFSPFGKAPFRTLGVAASFSGIFSNGLSGILLGLLEPIGSGTEGLLFNSGVDSVVTNGFPLWFYWNA